MSDTQNQNPTPKVQGAEELLVDEPNKSEGANQVTDEFTDFIQRANVVLAKKYDIIVPTTQDEMVFINNTIQQSENFRKQLNTERDKQYKYEIQGYAYPLKPEIKQMLEDMEKASNEYEVKAQEFLANEKAQHDKEAQDRAAAVAEDKDATPNLIPIPRPELPKVQGSDEQLEKAEESGQPANPNNPEGQTVEEQKEGEAPKVVEVDPNASGASDGSGGHQTPATGKPELKGKGIKTNVDNLQNLGGSGSA